MIHHLAFKYVMYFVESALDTGIGWLKIRS